MDWNKNKLFGSPTLRTRNQHPSKFKARDKAKKHGNGKSWSNMATDKPQKPQTIDVLKLVKMTKRFVSSIAKRMQRAVPTAAFHRLLLLRLSGHLLLSGLERRAGARSRESTRGFLGEMRGASRASKSKGQGKAKEA